MNIETPSRSSTSQATPSKARVAADPGDIRYFSEAASAEVVNARMGANADPRLRQVMTSVVKHLHEVIKEVEPTHDELMAAIQFLTDTGHKCNDWRQEFILLSDVLGATMLVDAINHRRPGGATENTILGPFFVPNSPKRANGDDICLDHKGEPMLVEGRVLDTQGRPVAGASIEVWQTNDDGFYDVQQKGVQPDWNLRGNFTSDADGRYWFRSVRPRFYAIPDDGPVGKLLGRIGRHPNRAAHMHLMVNAPGHEPVISHIFDPDCPYLDQDTVFGVKSSLIADFQCVEDRAERERHGFSGPFWRVHWDLIVLPLPSPDRK